MINSPHSEWVGANPFQAILDAPPVKKSNAGRPVVPRCGTCQYGQFLVAPCGRTARTTAGDCAHRLTEGPQPVCVKGDGWRNKIWPNNGRDCKAWAPKEKRA